VTDGAAWFTSCSTAGAEQADNTATAQPASAIRANNSIVDFCISVPPMSER
jgi:hypothetical protein